MNRLLRSIIILFITVAVCLTPVVPCKALSTTPNLLKKDVTARFVGSAFPGEYSIDIPYDDAFFLGDATQYDHALARFSLGTAMSACRSHDSEDDRTAPNVFINELFTDAGFSDITFADYEKSPSLYTISSCIGSKEISAEDEPFTLVAVAVCGGNYEKEWESNVTMGTGDRHEGFSNAADLVENRIVGYLARKRLLDKKIKLWITGYSRAGAVANITGADMTDMGIIPASDIFVYTYASPRVVKNNTKSYTNIYNIVGKMDIVPKFGAAEWGYDRYGTTFYTKCQEIDSDYEKCSKNVDAIFKKITGHELWNNPGDDQDLRLLYEYMVYCIPDSEAYVRYMQKDFVALIDSASPLNALNRFIGIFTNPDLLNESNRDEVEGFVNLLVQIAFETAIEDGESEIFRQDDALAAANLMPEHCAEKYLAWLMSSDDPDEIFSDSDGYFRVSMSGDGYFAVADHNENAIVDIGGYDESAYDPIINLNPDLDISVEYDNREFYMVYDDETGEQIMIFPDDISYDIYFCPNKSGLMTLGTAYTESFNRAGCRIKQQTVATQKGEAILLFNSEEMTDFMTCFYEEIDENGVVTRRIEEYSPSLLSYYMRHYDRLIYWQYVMELSVLFPVLGIMMLILIASLILGIRIKVTPKNSKVQTALLSTAVFMLLLSLLFTGAHDVSVVLTLISCISLCAVCVIDRPPRAGRVVVCIIAVLAFLAFLWLIREMINTEMMIAIGSFYIVFLTSMICMVIGRKILLFAQMAVSVLGAFRLNLWIGFSFYTVRTTVIMVICFALALSLMIIELRRTIRISKENNLPKEITQA